MFLLKGIGLVAASHSGAMSGRILMRVVLVNGLDAERDIEYLRRVPELRSKVSAHLRGH
jgi:hypothetical protein